MQVVHVPEMLREVPLEDHEKQSVEPVLVGTARLVTVRSDVWNPRCSFFLMLCLGLFLIGSTSNDKFANLWPQFIKL